MTRRRLPTLLVLAAVLIALALPAISAGAAPSPAPAAAQGGIQVRVPNFVFDPVLGDEPKLSSSERFVGQASGFRLVQFFGATEDAWLASLKAAGLRVLQYYPHYTYLVWGDAASLSATEAMDFVRWAGNFHPAYKMNSDLAGRSGVVKNVDVFFYNDSNVFGTVASLEALGAKVHQVYAAQPDQTFFIANAELNAAAFDAVSRLNTVLWFGYSHPEPVLDDEMSSQIVAGNYTAGVPFTGYYTHLGNLGYDGTGVRWATVDTGVDYNHPDLNGHIAGGYSFPGACNTNPGEDCAGGGHGTHVTGIMGGTGQGDGIGANADPGGFLYGLGIAPGYEIFAMNSLSAAAWPPAGGWQEHSKRAVLGGAIGGNNSWTTGEGANHGYQASERTHDIMVLDGNFDTASVAEPFIEVFSAGNSGPGTSTLTAPKEGKNLIVTAASRNYRVGSIDTLASFSSRGPAVDGRWVPTIAAPGEQIASTRNDLGGSCGTAIAGTNGLYSYCSGTSMAAPHASGAVVLTTEWWRTFNSGNDPSSAMAKALLVNGAIDMGTADIPNIHEGWGRINTTNIISPSAPTEYWDQPLVFDNSGESWSLQVGVADPSKPLKVTLAWADAPGAVGANPALVNNLDLTVVNGANTFLGNVFSGGWSQTGGAADSINNLENVFVQNPAGSATITVDATNIAGDAVLYSGDATDQSFALICYNCALFPDFTLDVTPGSQDICTPSDAVYDIAVGSVLGYSDPVTLSASGNPTGTFVMFSDNPVTPPGGSLLFINTEFAIAGSYTIDIIGIAPTSTHTSTVGLNIFTAAPAAPALASPANGALNVGLTPTLTWNATPQAGYYSIQIATDAAFSNIVDAASGIANTSYTTGVSLNTSTQYFWRVWAENTCGIGGYSATWSFTTEAGPGDCGPGTTANVFFQEGFESGLGGWTAGGAGNTWTITSNAAYVNSGAQAMHATAPASVSDQQLTSPAVTLPSGQNPVTLKFWNFQTLEDSGTGCYDGGILEISDDGGATWTQAPNATLLTDPYDGAVSGSFSNPLAGLDAWCGDPQPYLNSLVDVSSYAGQTVQFRFRLGTDSSVGRPDGWNIDDVIVQSCQTPTAVELSSIDAGASQSPVPLTSLPLAAAGMAGVALAVGYLSRRRNARA